MSLDNGSKLKKKGTSKADLEDPDWTTSRYGSLPVDWKTEA